MKNKQQRLAEAPQLPQPDLYLPQKNVPFDVEVMRIENITGGAVKSVRPIAYSWNKQQSDSAAGNITYWFIPPTPDAQAAVQNTLLYSGEINLKVNVVLDNSITNLYAGLISPTYRNDSVQRSVPMQYIANWASFILPSGTIRPTQLQTMPALFTNVYFNCDKVLGLAVIELSVSFTGFEITMK